MRPPFLVRLVDASRRHAVPVFISALLLAGLAGWAAKTHLGVSTDTDKLFRITLPWRQRQIAFERDFPQFKNQLVAVIDARIPEEADAHGCRAGRHAARRPGTFPHCQPAGCLTLFAPERAAVSRHQNADRSAEHHARRPAVPSASFRPIRRLAACLRRLRSSASGWKHGQADLSDYQSALEGFERNLHAAASGHPQPLSWETLLAGSLASQAGRYRFVLVQPKLDYGALEPGGEGTRILRADAAKLDFVRSGEAHVRVTGSIALADEEFATVAEGIVWGSIGSVLLITLWLFLAVGSWRLIVPILLTLLLGLALTTRHGGGSPSAR